MPTVNTPVSGFDGVIVGVDFRDGVGATDDPAALAYFRRKGYTVDDGTAGAPRGNASRGEWADYASGLGVEVTDEMSRNDIRAAVGGDVH